jgi:hypothetical protein
MPDCDSLLFEYDTTVAAMHWLQGKRICRPGSNTIPWLSFGPIRVRDGFQVDWSSRRGPSWVSSIACSSASRAAGRGGKLATKSLLPMP